MKTNEHPTVQKVLPRLTAEPPAPFPSPLDPAELKNLCLEAGADDAGFVEIGRTELGEDERAAILEAYPSCKALIGYVCRINREPMRTTARSVANLEFHQVGDQVNDVGRRIVTALEKKGVGAVNPAMGFPMEASRFPGRIWVVSHKLVAQQAGLGVMGIHRNVIHPRFGNFILLGTILLDTEISQYDRPNEYAPCLECKLCVAACPVGAISPMGDFNFNACYTHNYREFMGGFTNWVEEVADSRDRIDYHKRVPDNESVSMWQSLSYGANYKAAYCMSVCPAGEEVIAPFLRNKKEFRDTTLKPLQEKQETVYVIPGSDAESHVARRFPHKSIRHVPGSLRPRSLDQFVRGLPLVFQPGQSIGLDAVYHFTFFGREKRHLTVTIRNQNLNVVEGHEGHPSLRVKADTDTWLGFLAKEKALFRALLRGKILVLGNPLLLVRFGKCFPS